MAGYSKEDFMPRKGENEIPVDSCRSWFNSCEYCDKRFCEWISVDEEVYERIPDMPGFFMTALKNKNIIEVVNILYDQTNIKKAAISKMERVRKQISNRKSKTTKSMVLIRWMIIKELDERENGILCAHWFNNGVLPRFSTIWPGQNLMEKNEAIVFSQQIKKWCYRQKNPVWRKPKPQISKNIEEVSKCSFKACEICDSYFTPWTALAEVIERDSAPNQDGLVMLSVVYEKNRNVLVINSHPKNVIIPMKHTMANLQNNEGNYLKEFVNKNPRLEVRWLIIEDIDCDSSCFLYAHWLNGDEYPPYNSTFYPLPGEHSLNKNKHFMFHNNNNKWFYETEAFKPLKFSKMKSRRMLFDELENEDISENEQS